MIIFVYMYKQTINTTKGRNIQGVRASRVMRTHDGRREKENVEHKPIEIIYSNYHILNIT